MVFNVHRRSLWFPAQLRMSWTYDSPAITWHDRHAPPYILWAVLRIKPRAVCLLGKDSVEHHAQPYWPHFLVEDFDHSQGLVLYRRWLERTLWRIIASVDADALRLTLSSAFRVSPISPQGNPEAPGNPLSNPADHISPQNKILRKTAFCVPLYNYPLLVGIQFVIYLLNIFIL